jgi:hypothetical protein
MKNRQNILPFPAPPEEPVVRTIIVQIGNERFAIHWETEDLPPAAKPSAWRKKSLTVLAQRVKSTPLPED